MQNGRHMSLMRTYAEQVMGLIGRIETEEADAVGAAAKLIADHITRHGADRLIYVYGPGGHSNLAAQEVFFRAGGLVNVSAILDEGTLLSGGALRSMAIERTPATAASSSRTTGSARVTCSSWSTPTASTPHSSTPR